MKKIAVLLSALILATALCACQNKQDDLSQPSLPNTPDQSTDSTDSSTDSDNGEADSFTLDTVADDLLENASFPAMYTLNDADEIALQFGVKTENFTEVYAATADQYPGIERIFLAKYTEDADRDGVYSALNDYLETVQAEYIDYVPSEYAKSKNVTVYADGDYVALVIAGDSAKALNIVKNYIK